MKPHRQLIAAGLLVAIAGGAYAQSVGDIVARMNGAATSADQKNSDNKDKVDDKSGPQYEPRILQGTDEIVARPAAYTPIDGPSSSYKFEEAPIIDVISVFMREVLKVDYILHQPITGSVTMATRGPITPDNALALLESALQVNGYAMGRDSRGVYHIGKFDQLKGVVSEIRMAGGKGPLAPGYGAVIIPLQYIGAAEMAAILKPMVQGEAIVRVDTLRNLLVMVGTRTQAEGWLEMVKTFDVNMLKGMSVGVFPLKYASVKEVEAALQLLNSGASGAAPGGAGGAATSGRGAPPAGSAGGASSGAGGAAAAANAPAVSLAESFPLYGAIRVLPIARINSIMVVTPRAGYLEEARRWIEKLDKPSDNGAEPQLFIYQVQNVNSKHLATVLSGIFSGLANPFGGPNAAATGATGVAPGQGGVAGATGANAFNNQAANNPYSNNMGGGNNAFGGGAGGSFGQSAGTGFGSGGLNNMRQTNNANTNRPSISVTASFGNIRVVADELNNSVLIWATRAEYEKIESTLRRLDIPPTQVMIEASIVEVTLSDGLDYGLQWAFSDPSPAGRRNGYSGSGFIGGDPTGNINGGGTGDTVVNTVAAAIGKGFTYSLTNSAGSVRAILSALASQTKLKVVSSPSLMVLDNHTATIAVGEQQPVQTSQQTTPTGTGTNYVTNTIQYKDTGVNLVVTPSVNAGNLVTMQVDQMLTDVGAPVASAGNQTSFLQRQISSKVAVRSGDAIVLGGLIKDNNKTSSSGVPLLSSLPIVGALFGTKGSSTARTELLVVISPRVVRTDIDIREVSDDLRDRMKGMMDMRGLDRDKPPVQAPPLASPAPQ